MGARHKLDEGGIPVIVYTCVFGVTDDLHEPLNPGNARYVCFTDHDNIKSDVWDIVRCESTGNPMRACRMYKQRPFEVFGKHDVTLWTDAHIQLVVDPDYLCTTHPNQFVGFKHPKRQRIKDEAEAILRGRKAADHEVLSQLKAYQDDGWDTDSNPQIAITNGGFLLRRDTPSMREFGEMWHHEVQTRCLRDQMSLDYCAHKTGVDPDHFPLSIFRSPYIQFHPWHEKPASFA